MSDNNAFSGVEIPVEILESPALLFLYYRIEQILGIKSGSDSLVKLNEYLENQCGGSFVNNPASYENLLTSREQIFRISRFLTVNETYFFRESAHFDLLSALLPEIVKDNHSLKICSAATSIGCEAYSIAMLLDYLLKKGLDFDYSIDAFDVSAQAIETARNARYTSNAIRSDGSSWKHILDMYLINENNEYVIPQNIRSRVNFFNHNIMRGLDSLYDIIFFRNSLIYFSQRNRYYAINNLVESLNNNGLLFFGISETACAKHPYLSNRYLHEVFYFQKMGIPSLLEQLPDNCIRKIYETDFSSIKFSPETERFNKTSSVSGNISNTKKVKIKNTKNYSFTENKNKQETPLDFAEISEILKIDEGKSNAEKILKMFHENKDLSIFSISRITAGAVFLLNKEDFFEADKIISFLEENSGESHVKFLRGEYFFLQGKGREAEKYYQEAAVKDKYFWPAFYRIQSLASEGNRVRYEYKIKKTIESIDLVQNLECEKPLYECFIGGFSPDYFKRILEKKILRETSPQEV